MSTDSRSATAYEQLSALTDKYTEGQVRLQELRVLTRALRVLAATYCQESNVKERMGKAIVQMTEAASIERNRLYVEGTRLADEMERLNALIQNGVFNAE